ncbi:hypothetical protein [Vibrio coralliilyticus]|uniref:hypothetical protein n=1 Tax=Vibrio coralliilyticus TaxID=190893 RepID=UPI00117F3A0E|nr:hypothetical protein [Vibrio coralliilyticus]NOI56213.1 hypothetical protein [Vibrio coralliilyticus]
MENPRLYLEGHILKIWKSLNPTYSHDSKTYQSSSLIGRLENSIRKIKSKNSKFISVHCNNSEKDASLLLKYLLYLQKNDYKKLRETIASPPVELEVLISEAQGYLPDSLLFSYTSKGPKQTSMGKFLSKSLFNYTNYRSKNYCHNFFKDIGFDSATCPYCNEGKIKIVRKSNSRTEAKLLFHLDHFYPKSIFPYLSLSVFNHIPSCDTCNTSYKGDSIFKIETHIHPYHQSFHDIYSFRLEPNEIQNENIKSISIVNNGIKPLDCTSKDFGIEYRYRDRTVFRKSSKLVKTYKDYSHFLLKPELSHVFKDMLYNMHDIPKSEQEIIEKEYGKLYIDILKNIADMKLSDSNN